MSTDLADDAIKVCDSVKKADLVFILDSSGSINDTKSSFGKYNNWELALQSLVKIAEEVTVGLDAWRFGLVIFSQKARHIFFLNDTRNSADVVHKILSTHYLGSDTNTASALKLVREGQFRPERGDRPDVPNVVIIVTDGNSTITPER